MDMYIAIAEPNRRAILEMLAQQGQLAASDIADQFKITKSAVSQHLKVLLEAGLVVRKKRAQQRLYSINLEGIEELDEWASHLKDLWVHRLNKLEDVLNDK